MGKQLSKWEGLVTEGRTAFSQDNFALAEERFLEALRIAEGAPEQKQALESSLSLLAFFYCLRGRYQEAEGYWLRWLELLEQTYNHEAREVGTFIYNMAEWVYRPWGKDAEADRLRQRAEVICGEGFFRRAKYPTS
ncbi:MAG: tetratricopeptide repeat protein [Acidobacteriota bacterium]|nr:tetratricopeptide repeat protein [Acidobacteriota bacterium]